MPAASAIRPVSPGVSQLVGRVLDRGTVRRSANAISDALDDRGVALRVTTTRHRLSISCTCLTEDFPDVLAILLDVARRPTFPESEIEQPRAETVTALRQDDDNPAVRALDAVAALSMARITRMRERPRARSPRSSGSVATTCWPSTPRGCGRPV